MLFNAGHFGQVSFPRNLLEEIGVDFYTGEKVLVDPRLVTIRKQPLIEFATMTTADVSRLQRAPQRMSILAWIGVCCSICFLSFLFSCFYSL